MVVLPSSLDRKTWFEVSVPRRGVVNIGVVRTFGIRFACVETWSFATLATRCGRCSSRRIRSHQPRLLPSQMGQSQTGSRRESESGKFMLDAAMRGRHWLNSRSSCGTRIQASYQLWKRLPRPRRPVPPPSSSARRKGTLVVSDHVCARWADAF